MNKKIAIILILIIFSASLIFASDSSKEVELLFMAKKAYEDGFYEVSLGMLERFQKDFKDSSKKDQARLLSGQCYFNQGRYLEALSIFEELFNDSNAAIIKDALYFWIAEVHFKGSNFEKASLLYQKLINDFPQSYYAPAAYYSLGWSLAQIGKYKQAYDAFNNLTAKFPLEPQAKDAAFKIIECLYNLKEYSELKNRITPILKLYSADTLRLPYLYFYLAESEYYLNNFEEAIKNYLLAAQLFKEQKASALAKLGLGWSYLKLEKFKDAQEVFADIKQSNLDKKNLDIFVLGQAMLASQTNRIYEAKKLYEQLISISSDPLIIIQAYLGKADMLYNLADYLASVNVYQEALDKALKTEFKESLSQELINKLRYSLSLAFIKNGQINSGIQILEMVMNESNDQEMKTRLFFQIADAYEKTQEFLKAENTYLKILSLYPDSYLADYLYYRIGLAQYKRGDLDKAVASFELVLKNYAQSKFVPDSIYSLGLVYFQKTDYLKSYEYFNKFKDNFKENPLRAEALYMLGMSMINLEKFNEAIDTFKEIIKVSPKNIELVQNSQLQTADCYYRLGQEQEAFNKFKMLRSKYPDSKLTADIMFWLGQYYYRHNDFNLARRYFSSLIKDFPHFRLIADAYYVLGLVFINENNFVEAINNLNVAIKQGNPDLRVQAVLALANAYNGLGKAEEAIMQYKKIIDDQPELGKILFSQIGELFYKMQDYQQAKVFYNKAFQVTDKENPDLYFRLAETLEANSEFDAAIKQYFLALKFYAQDIRLTVQTLLRIAKIYEDKENFSEALTIYKTIIQKDVPEAKSAQERIDWIKSH